MKIAIDLQGCQNQNNRYRGIGRYSLSVIKNLIRDSEDQFILVSNANLPNISLDFKKELSASNSKVTYLSWHYPEFNSFCSKDQDYFRKIATILYSYTYLCIQPDVILLTSFFDGFEDFAITQFDHKFDLPPIACIFYDLIPLLNPNLYFDGNSKYKKFYMERIRDLNKLDLLLTISEFTKAELINTLSLEKIDIKNISSGCNNEIFSVQAKNLSEQIKLLDNYENFILYVGAVDPRKNIKRLIEAYSLLKKSVQDKFTLVLAGCYNHAEKLKIKNYIVQFGISAKSIILSGYISDNELAYLYKNCSLFVMPSLHEGFGLPLLEAMSCGAPAICSNLTSLPEVIGNEEALFDPYNSKEIASLITRCLTDVDFANSLIRKGLERSKLFSWKKTAENLYEAIKHYEVPRIYDSESIELNWELFKTNKKKNFDFLRDRLFQLNNLDFSLENHLEIISACIDLIDKSTTDLARKINDIPRSFNWRLEGPFDSSYSLAILNSELSIALKNLNHNVSINITEGNGDYPIDLAFIQSNNDLYKIYKNDNNANLSTINSRNMYPPRVIDSQARINILHSYGWEETQINQDWIHEFNNSLQGISVMSSTVKKILIDNGFSKPIAVSHLGVDHIKKEPIDFYNLKAKKFKYLHISSCFPRKGIDVLLDAYRQLFSSLDDVTLIIKSFPNPHNNIKSKLRDLKNKYPDFPDVLYIESDLKPSEIRSLYKQCDVLVAPSYGEGFGLPIAEAMLFKIPVITTDWGGQKDFCSSDTSWLIDYEFEYSSSHFDLYSSVWAKPSVEDLMRSMSELYANANAKANLKLTKAYDLICSEYTWAKCAERNTAFVKKLLLLKQIIRPKIGWVTTWNTRCGIASYSHNLIKYFSDEITILAPNQDNLVAEDSNNVIRCWDLDDKDSQSLTELFETVITEKFTSLVIQFNYGFYDFKEFEKFLDLCFAEKISIYIILHSTIDPKKILFKNLRNIQRVFSLSDRLLVHTPQDLNRLKKIGLVDNVSLFPHGIVDFSVPNYLLNDNKSSLNSISSKILNLASFGYCLPNKGFPELIKAIGVLQERDIAIHLQMFTALYDESFKWFYQELIHLRDGLGLKQKIDIDINYLSEDKILNALSKVDLIVYPYQTTNESSSAAVRQGIASGTKVAVTPLPIFNDVAKVVRFLPGTSVDDIALGINEFYKDYLLAKKNETLIKEKELHEGWLDQHRFSRVSVRLQGLIRGVETDKYFSD